VWLWAAGGVLALAIIAGGIYGHPWTANIRVVAVETVVLGPVRRVLAVNGHIAALVSVDLHAQVSGMLVELRVAEGDAVQKAQVLAQLDSAAPQASLRQAMAGLDAALVAQEAARAAYARTLAMGSHAPRVALDDAARAQLGAGQETARLTALLDLAQIQLDKFTLRAPMTGTVVALHADPGQNVDPATLLMTIGDVTDLVVETTVDESYAAQIHTGQSAALQLSGETALRPAHVSFLAQRVEADTGGLAVKLAPDGALIAPIGLTVTANITVDERALAITLPRAGLLRTPEGDGVLVVQKGRAERRWVQVIDWPAARLIVTKGLAAGDVVIADATGLVAGQAVKVGP
jgi:RND family efflux transporter MFP subunit